MTLEQIMPDLEPAFGQIDEMAVAFQQFHAVDAPNPEAAIIAD